MAEALALVLTAAGFPAGLWLCLRWLGGAGGGAAGAGRRALDTGPQAEPCWSEEIGRDGPLVRARACCPDRLLMEMDDRARRGDFPVPLDN